jgi:hypothetical protein
MAKSNNGTVTVKIEVLTGIDNFVQKLAALDGSTREQWYQRWIGQAFAAIADNSFTIEELDEVKMKLLYVKGAL